MGAFDDLIPKASDKKRGAFDDLIPRGGEAPQGSTVGDWAAAAPSALGQGALNIQQALGTFAQAPAANTLALVTGAPALADRGISSLASWLLPKPQASTAGGAAPVQPDESLQRLAQSTSGFAGEQRAANVDTKGGSWLNPSTALARFGLGLQEDARARAAEDRAALLAAHPEVGRQQQAIEDADGFFGTIKASAQNPLGTAYTLARSAPDMLAGLGVARAAAGRVLARAASEAERAAATVAAAGGDVAAQSAAAKAVMDAAGPAAERAASTAGMLAEPVSTAYTTRESVYQDVMGRTFDQLQAGSPRYREMVAQGMRPEQARERLANELGDQSTLAAAGTLAGSAITRRLFGADTTAKTVAGVERIKARDVVKNVAEESVEEGLQGVPEDISQVIAQRQADPNTKLDLGGSLAQNVLAGGLMAAPGTSAAYAGQRIRDLRSGIGADASGKPAAQAAAAGQAVPASDVLGRETEVPRETSSSAEKALFTPRSATALDRVQEIDRVLPTAPEADREALQVEREALTKGWPTTVPGAPTTFSTETGAKLAGQYALVEASELHPSHDIDLKANPVYPAELQPRDRERAASATQIASIVGRLDPARLGASADAGTGAPIIGADGLVESGNARTIALQRVYSAQGQKAEDYKVWLRSTAPTFGLTPEQVDGMRQPVLVRVRGTPVDRAEFARQANASTVAAMSPLEQARSDAARIDSMDDLRPTEDGEFSNSRAFISRFIARLAPTDRAALVDASGMLSAAGYGRVRNAVLAKAYGDSPVLSRLVESMDDSLRNVSRALIIAAPRMAQLRAAIAQGNLHNADLVPHLVAAVTELGRLRSEGTSVDQALAQQDLGDDRLTPEARDLLRFLGENVRRPRRIADLLTAYADALDAAGSPKQDSLLGESAPPSVADLLAGALREMNPASAAPAASAAATSKESPDGQEEGRRRQEVLKPGGATAAGMDDRTAGASPADQTWAAFGPETGTRGIPRAQMPQVPMADRQALLTFLDAKGVHHEIVEADPAGFKPSQAEYSLEKVERAKSAPEKTIPDVMLSSDGFIVDGHHRWLAKSEAGEPMRAIQFDAPLDKVLAAIHEFPKSRISTESAGATVVPADELERRRAAAVADLKNALADLGDALSKNTRAAVVAEKGTPVYKALVAACEAGIVVIGTDLQRLMRWVKDLVRGKPEFKGWEKIPATTWRAAAAEALDNVSKRQGAQTGLFTEEEAAAAMQGDLFAAAPAVVAAPASPAPAAAAMIDGRSYEPKRDNFKPPSTDSFLPDDLIQRARDYIAKFQKEAAPIQVSDQDRAQAEALLAPMLQAAGAVKVSYDQKIIDIAKRTGALGQLIAPLKGMKRAAEKLVEEHFQTENIRDLLRSTIVVRSYDELQRVLDAIRSEFEIVPKRIKNRTDRTLTGDHVRNEGFLPSGYGDTLINVWAAPGVQAEIQINVPTMLAAKEAEGHKLYEIERAQAPGSDLQRAIAAAQVEMYQAAAAAADRQASSDSGRGSEVGGQTLAGTSTPLTSEKAPLSGTTTASDPLSRSKNFEPGGNLSGTSIATSPESSVPQGTNNDYTIKPEEGRDNVDSDRNAGRGTEGPGAEVQGGTAGQGNAAVLPEGSGGRDQRPGGERAGRRQPDEAGREPGAEGGPAGVGGSTGAGSRAGAGAGVPAGRNIPAKSGRNYRFTADDVSPPGSWRARAAANVTAVELVKKLQAEGRLATREEQAVLARFVGWGASEIANNLFSDKLDAQAETLRLYELAAAAFDKRGNKPMSNDPYAGRYGRTPEGWWDAFNLLRAADPKVSYYSVREITREQIDKAAPPKATRDWISLRDRLKAALTPEEWDEAKRTTQYGHYTAESIVRGMWAAAERFGFKGGLVVEPGAGKGTFPGLMPQGMATSSAYTGIEYDSITGEILRHLFPDEFVRQESFVDTKLPRDFFDLAVGNPPFSGNTVTADPEYREHAFSLHDYFFAKTLDRVRPGGLLMFVTSRFTMDKKGDAARQFMADRADLLGAIRLPQSAFRANAGTEVVTDVLFLRKKVPGAEFDGGRAWTATKAIDIGGKSVEINEYFAAHPDMVLGTPALVRGMHHADEYSVLPPDGDIGDLFGQAVQRMPAGVFDAALDSAATAARVREIDLNPKAVKEGAFYVSDKGVLMQREMGVGMEVPLVDRSGKKAQGKSAADQDLIRAYIPLRDALKQAQYDQLTGGDWEKSLAALQSAYKGFIAVYGQVNQNETRRRKVMVDELDEDGQPTGQKIEDIEETRAYPLVARLADDPDITLVQALEDVNEETGAVSESVFLSKRVLGGQRAAAVATPHDALLSVLGELGRVDIPAIAAKLDLPEQEAIDALGTAIYRNPEGSRWEMADQYLSGNVVEKLRTAELAAKTSQEFQRNVEALRVNQPAPKSPAQINVTPGMAWIPSDVYEQFLEDTANLKARVRFNEVTGRWLVKPVDRPSKDNMRAWHDWGTSDRHAGEILQAAMSGKPVRVTKTEPSADGKSERTVTVKEATDAANAKVALLREEFSKWIWRDEARTSRLVALYNEKFNTDMPRQFDGRHLTLPGSSSLIDVYDHVKRGAWRIISSGNTYLAHAVGSGKTWSSVISAMEQRRLGLINKPMFVVPRHMLGQFSREWLQLYPAAKLMVADEEQFAGDNRRRFVARAAMNDLDGIVITHDAFKKLELDPKFVAGQIAQQVSMLRAAIAQDLEDARDDATGSGRRGKAAKPQTVKRMEARIEKLEDKLKALQSGQGKDKNVRLDEMGVDFLYVDEAHVARRLDIATTRQLKGITTEGSQLSNAIYMAIRWLDAKRPGRSAVFMSGTPITNTMGEMYTVQRMLGERELREKGLQHFDAWVSNFGREITSLEPNAAGQYEMVTRLKRFVNVGELTMMFRQFADVLTADYLAQILGDKRPKVAGGARKIVVTPKTSDYKLYQRILAERYKASREWKPKVWGETNPDPVIAIIGDGRMAAIDMRFAFPDAPSDPNSKLNKLIDRVIERYRAGADLEYTDKKTGQVEPVKGSTIMVFSKIGFGEGAAKNRGFNARAWFDKRMREAGIPPSHVAWMSDHQKSADKVRLVRDFNAGKVRILIGSDANMGTGINGQQRLLDLFHLDTPWFPADVEQREGRIVRQGNKNKVVNIWAYAAKGTYDEQMWGLVASKQRFIDQALSGDPNIREIEDLSEASLAEQAAGLLAEDPRVLQLAGVRADVERLDRLYQAHEDQRQQLRHQVQRAQQELDALQATQSRLEAVAAKAQDLSGDKFVARVGASDYTERKAWAQAIKAKAKDLAGAVQPAQTIGSISGFPVRFLSQKRGSEYAWAVAIDVADWDRDTVILRDLNDDDVGMARRATNAVADVARAPAMRRDRIAQLLAQVDAIEPRLQAEFPMLEMLTDKRREAAELEREIANVFHIDEDEIQWATMGAALGMIPAEAPAAAEDIPAAAESDLLLRQERAVYKVNEKAGFDVPIDLFPDTLPTGADESLPKRARGPAAKPASAGDGDVRPAGSVPASADAVEHRVLAMREDPALPGVYYSSSQLVEVGRRELPAARVTTWSEAASALSALKQWAVEHVEALVTDKDGVPLAVVGLFKGDTSSATIPMSTMLAEALRIENAANIWVAHNHPTGQERLSDADKRLSGAMWATFRPSTIQYRGVAAIGSERWQAHTGSNSDPIQEGVLLAGKTRTTVPIVSRTLLRDKVDTLPQLNSPRAAGQWAAKVSGGKPGVMLMDHNGRFQAWVPLNVKWMGALAGNGRFDRLINSATQAGATLAVIVDPGRKIKDFDLKNMVAAFGLADVEVQDVVDPRRPNAFTLAEKGNMPLTGGRFGTVFSRGEGRGGMAAAALRQVAERIKGRLRGLPPVEVLASVSEAPAALRDFIVARGADADVEGALHDGRIYLFASGLADELRAEHVLAEHEAAHAGLRGLLGPAGLRQAMQALWNGNASIRRAARDRVASGMSVAEAVEEVIVDIPTADLPKLKGWRALAAKLRDWLSSHGLLRLAHHIDGMLSGSLSQQQRADLLVADLVRRSRDFVAAPDSVSADEVQSLLARSMEQDAGAQAQWLEAKAREAGFASVDDMAAKDEGGFNQLARRWREDHPAAALMSRGRLYEDRSGSPPPPGREFIVYRVSSESSLKNSNAGNSAGVAAFLAAGDDHFNPTVEARGTHLRAYRVRADAPFGDYRTINAGRGSPAAALGRREKFGGVQYSFPDGGFEASEIASVPMSDVHQRLKSLGFDSFDDSGSRIGARVLRQAVDDALARETRLSVAATATVPPVASDAAQRAEEIIQESAATPKPVDAALHMLTRVTRLERLTSLAYDLGGRLLDRITPEKVKAGLVSDYGVPEAVIDQRAELAGRMQERMRKAGGLLEKLATMTRSESRVAYEWMNEQGDTARATELLKDLPEASVAVLRQVQTMIDELSREAVRLGMLDPETYKRHAFAYLRRSYFKHTQEFTPSEKRARSSALRILGDQYIGRGMVDDAPMKRIQNIAPEWWKRKFQEDKADRGLKGERFERLERRAPSGDGVNTLDGIPGGKVPGRILEVHYWPAGEAKPARYADWDSAGIWDVVNTKGDRAVMWRDFTKEERTKMGEIDEARFAIAKTLHRMIHDVEIARHLEWLAHTQALKEGQEIPGPVVDASERMLDTFKPGEWVRVPETRVPGTDVSRYGKLAGRYVPGPVWNDVRQSVAGPYKPLGETYQQILRMWKTAKTALSPAVHMNNVMSNFVMADWQGVTGGHVAKALRILLAAHQRDGKGIIGRAGNAAAASGGISDREAALEIVGRYQAAGGSVGTWVTQEIANEQLEPIVEALRAEVQQAAGQGDVGIYAALQHALHAKFPSAWQAFKSSKPAQSVVTEGKNLIDVYQAEDDVFRLACWLMRKEQGASDIEAGKAARRSFIDYRINAPWVQMMRSTAFPFVAFTYRAVPLLLEVAARHPHKVLKLMMFAGLLNMIGTMIAGGGDERKLLPDEKAGGVWGLVPKLIRMPWNDAHGSPVYLDIRRFIPVGDVFDLGQGHAALPVPPSLMPGGPLAVMGELFSNRSWFTGKPITLDTDTAGEKSAKLLDYAWKTLAPNLLGVPGTYATQGVSDAMKGRTDAFGRELSVSQALANTVGIKLGSYPADVLRRNIIAERDQQIREIDLQIAALRRQRITHRIDQDEFQDAVRKQRAKELEVRRKAAEKIGSAAQAE